jgi:ABC-type Na+ efflux pump permease subunit
MPFLPIAERELRVAARRRSIYRVRFWAVLAAAIVFLWRWVALVRMNTSAAGQGHQMFIGLSILAMVFALSAGLYTTSDCLSAEKREGTMGLLFLTDLKGYDIVFGKLVASSLSAAYGLVAIVPVLAIPILLGGVTIADFLNAVITIVSLLFLSLSVGMVASTHNRNERKSTFYTCLILFLVFMIPLLTGFMLNVYFSVSEKSVLGAVIFFSPALMASRIFGAMMPSSVYWTSLGATWGWTILFLLWVAHRLPSSWQEKTPTKKKDTAKNVARIQRKVEARKKLRGLLDVNPFLWLSFRAEKKRNYVWLFLSSMLGMWFICYFNYGSIMFDYDVLLPVTLFLNPFFKIWAITEGCQQLIEARRSGALELLLSTPLTHQQVIRGQWLALFRQFGWAVGLLFGLEVLAFWHSRGDSAFFMAEAFFLPIDFLAAGWIGMWLGLTATNTTRAILKGTVLLLALPWVVFYLGTLVVYFLDGIRGPSPTSSHVQAFFWSLISLVVAYLCGIQWARKRLFSEFRSIASNQFHSKTAATEE